MATLNPQSLVTLWQIEQYGSFSATAKATGWSQPAISQQIKKLEAQCGSTLVQRTSHGVELTATGSMLARHGEAIADRLERAAREVEDYRHHRFDHLHLVAPPSICSTIAARTVVKLSMFTDIELSLIQMEPPEAIGLISQGKADTAAVFRYSSIPNFLHIGDDLTFHSLGYDPMRLLVRRSSGIAKRFEETGEPVPLSAAKDEHWIAGCPTCRANLVKLATRPDSSRISATARMITGPRRTWSRLVWASRWCRRSIRISTCRAIWWPVPLPTILRRARSAS